MSSTDLLEQLAAVHAERDALLAQVVETATPLELVEVLAQEEQAKRRAPVVEHAIINRLGQESPIALGGKTLKDVLVRRLRIRDADAERRIDDAEKLSPRTTLTGQPLPPVWPTFAAAQQRGLVGPDHLAILRNFFDKLPSDVDYQTREAAEEELGAVAATFGPKDFDKAASGVLTEPGRAVLRGGPRQEAWPDRR